MSLPTKPTTQDALFDVLDEQRTQQVRPKPDDLPEVLAAERSDPTKKTTLEGMLEIEVVEQIPQQVRLKPDDLQ